MEATLLPRPLGVVGLDLPSTRIFDVLTKLFVVIFEGCTILEVETSLLTFLVVLSLLVVDNWAILEFEDFILLLEISLFTELLVLFWNP